MFPANPLRRNDVIYDLYCGRDVGDLHPTLFQHGLIYVQRASPDVATPPC